MDMQELVKIHQQTIIASSAKPIADNVEIERLKKVEQEYIKLQDAALLAYGYLWHVTHEPLSPRPKYSPQQASIDARKILRDRFTSEQRGVAINKVQSILGG